MDQQLRDAERQAASDPSQLKKLIYKKCRSGDHAWSPWASATILRSEQYYQVKSLHWHDADIAKRLGWDPEGRGVHLRHRKCFFCKQEQTMARRRIDSDNWEFEEVIF